MSLRRCSLKHGELLFNTKLRTRWPVFQEYEADQGSHKAASGSKKERWSKRPLWQRSHSWSLFVQETELRCTNTPSYHPYSTAPTFSTSGSSQHQVIKSGQVCFGHFLCVYLCFGVSFMLIITPARDSNFHLADFCLFLDWMYLIIESFEGLLLGVTQRSVYCYLV